MIVLRILLSLLLMFVSEQRFNRWIGVLEHRNRLLKRTARKARRS